jgi:hypothetical protein
VIYSAPRTVKWWDPASLPKGAKLAVLLQAIHPRRSVHSNPVRDARRVLRSPRNHTHPTDEHVTVIRACSARRMAPKRGTDAALHDMAAGSYANMAAQMAHYVRPRA